MSVCLDGAISWLDSVARRLGRSRRAHSRTAGCGASGGADGRLAPCDLAAARQDQQVQEWAGVQWWPVGRAKSRSDGDYDDDALLHPNELK
jgi:hypothetical protein